MIDIQKVGIQKPFGRFLTLGSLISTGAFFVFSLLAMALWTDPVVAFLERIFSPDGKMAHPWAATFRLAVAPFLLICQIILSAKVIAAGHGRSWQVLLFLLVPLHIVAFKSMPVLFTEDGVAENLSALFALLN